MVEVGPRTKMLGPAAIVILLVLAVAGAVADDNRGGAGHPSLAARNVSYNATIAPGASIAIGFQATHTGETAEPASFALNGAVCAIA